MEILIVNVAPVTEGALNVTVFIAPLRSVPLAYIPLCKQVQRLREQYSSHTPGSGERGHAHNSDIQRPLHRSGEVTAALQGDSPLHIQVCLLYDTPLSQVSPMERTALRPITAARGPMKSNKSVSRCHQHV